LGGVNTRVISAKRPQWLPLLTFPARILVTLIESSNMVRRTSSASAQKKLDELLDSVQRRRDTVVITSAGKPVAARRQHALYERVALMQADFEKSLAKLRRATLAWPGARRARKSTKPFGPARRK